jgi:hypothetical protein
VKPKCAYLKPIASWMSHLWRNKVTSIISQVFGSLFWEIEERTAWFISGKIPSLISPLSWGSMGNRLSQSNINVLKH